MTFGQYSFSTFHANVDRAAADRMVGLALDAGVNLFDTAESYGQGRSEEVLGAALRRAGARERAVISTKVSTFGTGSYDEDRDLLRLSYRHVIGNAEAALRRLGTDWIDLYLLHQPDFVTPWEETLRALDDLVSRGLVRYVGWSNFPAWHAARGQAIQAWRGVRAVRFGADLLLAGRPRGRARDPPVLSRRRHWDADLEPACQWLPDRQVHARGPTGGGGRRAAFSVPPIDLQRGYDAV